MGEEILFQPGDSIVPMSLPFLKALHMAKKGRLCDNCFKPGQLRHCAACQKSHYCGKACQRQDWKEGHSVECKSEIFRNPSSIAEGAFRLLLDENLLPKVLRTLAKFHRSPESFSEKHSVYGGLVRSFNDMMSNEDKVFEHKPTTLFLSKLFPELQKDFSYGLVEFDEDFLRRIFGVWTTNSFQMVNEDESESIGAGLYIPHSAVNHGCRPNAVRVSSIDKLEIRAIHPIPKGAEPVISYLAGNRNLGERQSVLQTRYNFTCACDLCTSETNSGPVIDYGKLKFYKEKLLYCHETRYQSITDIRDQGLTLFRKLYHEYDERITNFCSLSFDILCQFNDMYHNVPKAYLRNAGNDLKKRLEITFGPESFNYGECLQKMKRLGF